MFSFCILINKSVLFPPRKFQVDPFWYHESNSPRIHWGMDVSTSLIIYTAFGYVLFKWQCHVIIIISDNGLFLCYKFLDEIQSRHGGLQRGTYHVFLPWCAFHIALVRTATHKQHYQTMTARTFSSSVMYKSISLRITLNGLQYNFFPCPVKFAI